MPNNMSSALAPAQVDLNNLQVNIAKVVKCPSNLLLYGSQFERRRRLKLVDFQF